MKLLLVAATRAEIQQCLDYLALNPDQNPFVQRGGWEIHVLISGVGLMATTFALTRKLAETPFDFVLQAGIGGLFQAPDVPQPIALGDLVMIGAESLGDLGAEDHHNYLSIFDLGFLNKEEAPFTGGKLINSFKNSPFPLLSTTVDSITVHTVSGQQTTIDRRYAGLTQAAESMEGAALHYVCLMMKVPFLQVRAISNYVTPRDRSSWQIGKAVKALNDQLIAWLD
jgi:futalosine hydrolase